MPRRLLYLTPYFPPLARVGALRPLKFVRFLPDHDWLPVVVCDLWQGAQVDLDLLGAVPPGVPVERVWSRRAQSAWRRIEHTPPSERSLQRVRSPAQQGKMTLRDRLPDWLNNPELIPLGEHGPRMPYNRRAVERVLKRYRCDAVLVNADPYAAALVGRDIAVRHGLPLIVDLRDPWAPCELRRPRRPRPIRALVDRLERSVVEASDAVILNTRQAQQDYRSHYSDLPSERFQCIHNHFDEALIRGGAQQPFDAFSLLFLGNFGRFIKAGVLLQVLVGIKARGFGPEQVQLVVTGRFPETSWRLARGMGVQDMIRLHPHVPYRQIGAVMEASDLLVLMIQPRGRQRFAAKLFDYLASSRPIVAISDNPEVDRVLETCGAGKAFGHEEVDAVVDYVVEHIGERQNQSAPKDASAYHSKNATARLVEILDASVASNPCQ